MKLKTRVKMLVSILVAIVVILNTTTIIGYISNSLKSNAVHSINYVSNQTLITFTNLLDSVETFSQLPLMDSEIFAIMNKKYSDSSKDKYEKYKDMDVVQSKLYSEMFYKNKYVYSATIIPFNTDIVYSKQRVGFGANIEKAYETEWFREVYNSNGRETCLFPCMEDDLHTRKEKIISIGRLLYNPMTETKLGVYRIDIAVKDLENIWNKEHLFENSEVIIVDENNRLLYTSLKEEMNDFSWEEYEGIENEEDQAKHIRKSREYAIYTEAQDYGIKMITLVPEKTIYENAYRTILIIILVGILCILIAWILSEGFSRSMMKPIGELNGLMKEVRSGDLTVRAKVSGVGEFEEVCESFNLMVENTQSLINRIYEEQTEKREMEYQALQAQISPHFTLNTINTIKWMAFLQGSKSIETALDSLAHILTFAVREKSEKIPIEIEIEQMEYYVNILSLRYCNKFDISFNIEENVKKCLTLKYVLQTIVENSIFHGFDELQTRGKIEVKIFAEGNEIVYTVRDNGKGMSEERIKEVLKTEKKKEEKGNKIGIYNINRRIKLIFGEQYGIQIHSEMGKYTEVVVHIPREEQG